MDDIEKSDDFLARWLAGELSAEEREAFERSPGFAAYQKIVAAADRLPRPEADTGAMWERFQQKTVVEKPPSPRRWPLVLAVAGLLAALGWLWFFKMSKGEKAAPPPAAPNLLIAKNGERRSATLPDGSTVRLNAATEIRFDSASFSKDRTLLLVAGEVWFEVKKGATPFRVVAAVGTVEAVGTVFSVRSRGAVLRVECFEGRVRAAAAAMPGGPSVEVAAGQKTTLDGAVWSPVAPADGDRPGFLRGESRFDGEALRLVANEMQRQFDLDITLADGLGSRPFSGAFPNDDAALALRLVCEPLGLRAETTGRRVHISPK